MNNQHTNALIHSTSPYLLQHAHNPVNWQPWDDNLINQNNNSGKLLLVSIGYAACHWCHVMEHESFEDEDVAKVMNDNYICIKVDREERPDVDNYYMTAVHLMGLQGGWPLNVIALPNGRPLWGGTYFPRKTWIDNLTAVAQFWQENKDKALEYGHNLQAGIEQSMLAVVSGERDKTSTLSPGKGIQAWKKRFDHENGGRTGYPKFPMPVNLEFLLYYGTISKDVEVTGFVELTLQKMAFGGIYDQIGGGFARYATDEKWKVPHFEKMLYDNGQLLSLYAHGYQKFGTEDFKNVVYETAGFIERELMSPQGAFYSSLDADSEGEEGKFYVWNQQELKEILHQDFDLFSKYFNVNEKGLWEKGNYILLRDMYDDEFAARNEISVEALSEKVSEWKKLLLEVRAERIRPGLDDKTLLSWNALAISGLTDAYKVFGDAYFRNLAIKNGDFIRKNMVDEGGKVFHSWKSGKNAVDGFLDDYALLIQAYISLFQVTGADEWLVSAEQLLNYTLENFYDSDAGMFLYVARNPRPALTNHFQIEDNVVPAANSVMANNLYSMYLLLGKPDFRDKAETLLNQVTLHFQQYPHAFANWGTLMLKLKEPFFEVVVCGKQAEDKFLEMQSDYRPNVLWAFSSGESSVPLLKDRYKAGENLIYVCRNGSCQLPVKDTQDAVRQIEVV